MSLFSNLFKRTPAEPEPPRTREELEASLSVQETKTLSVSSPSGVLQTAFQTARPALDEEKKLLKDALDLVALTPTGKKLIDEAAKNGFEFYFDASYRSSLGSMSAINKKVMLCPSLHATTAGLAATAVHEMTHALQNAKSGNMFDNVSGEYQLSDQFKFHRAAEAGAWTEEAKFAYELQKIRPDLKADLDRDLGAFPMYHVFSEEMEKSNDTAKAGEATFKAWYNFDHYRRTYEEDHVNSFSFYMRTRSYVGKNSFEKSLSSEKVLDYVFASDGIRQAISPDFLTSKEAFSLSKGAAARLKQAVNTYYRGQEEPSIDNMYSYETGKTFASEKQTQAVAASKAPPKKSLMSSLSEMNKGEMTPSLAGNGKTASKQQTFKIAALHKETQQH